MSKRIAAVIVLLSLLGAQCTDEVAKLDCTESAQASEVFYTRDVFPIVSKSCAVPTCHVATFPKGDFTKFEDLKAKADNGMLSFKLSNGQMPPEFSNLPLLAPCDVNKILTWVNQGAKNN